MSSHGARGRSPDAPGLPGTVPFSVAASNRLSWELGSEVVTDATLLGTWEQVTTGRTLTVYDVTDHIAVLAVRTPVGRERFFGIPRADWDAKRNLLDDAKNWRRE